MSLNIKQIFVQKVIFEDDKLININDLSDNLCEQKIIYEIFKIIGGKPVFIKDHISRLQQSLQKTQTRYIIDIEQITKSIEQICKYNNTYFGNMELMIVTLKNNTTISYLGFIKHSYPEVTMYMQGIETQTVGIERNTPNIKIKNTEARQIANSYIEQTKLYEVLLLNKDNLLTEGSRSNLFFIKDDTFFTAPDSVVLKGITRLKIISIINKIDCKLIYKAVSIDELKNYQSAFICGTSIGVLPICKINNIKYDLNNKILRTLILEFNDLVNQYLS